MNAQFGVLAALVSFLSVLVAVVIRAQDARISRMEARQDRLEEAVSELGHVNHVLQLAYEGVRLLGLDLVRLCREALAGTSPDPPQLAEMEARPSAGSITAEARRQAVEEAHRH